MIRPEVRHTMDALRAHNTINNGSQSSMVSHRVAFVIVQELERLEALWSSDREKERRGFAATALQGFLASFPLLEGTDEDTFEDHLLALVGNSVAVADALQEELERDQDDDDDDDGDRDAPSGEPGSPVEARGGRSF